MISDFNINSDHVCWNSFYYIYYYDAYWNTEKKRKKYFLWFLLRFKSTLNTKPQNICVYVNQTNTKNMSICINICSETRNKANSISFSRQNPNADDDSGADITRFTESKHYTTPVYSNNRSGSRTSS